MHRTAQMIWLTWLLAPGSFAVISITCWFCPEVCTDPPNCCFAATLVATHGIGAIYGLILFHDPGPSRRTLEYRALYVYALAIAGWFLAAVARSYIASWACVWLANLTTGVVAVVGATRLVSWLRSPDSPG